MKNTKLTLIKGGSVSTKKGGGSTPPPKPKFKKKQRPHPLNNLLWMATSRIYYPHRATSTDDVAKRMTKLSRRVIGRHLDVTAATATQVIFDCRRRHRAYSWTLFHAQKGSGDLCGFVPVPCDVDEDEIEIYLIDDDDIGFIEAGLKSSIGTVSSMIDNDASALTLLIGCLEAQGKRKEADRWREFAAELRTFSRRAAEIRKHAEVV
jgi:hypothetical protein